MYHLKELCFFFFSSPFSPAFNDCSDKTEQEVIERRLKIRGLQRNCVREGMGGRDYVP